MYAMRDMCDFAGRWETRDVSYPSRAMREAHPNTDSAARAWRDGGRMLAGWFGGYGGRGQRGVSRDCATRRRRRRDSPADVHMLQSACGVNTSVTAHLIATEVSTTGIYSDRR